MERVKIFLTRPDPTDQPVSNRPGRPFFLQEIFVHCSMHITKNFQIGEGHG